jgi:hypothetical protein
VLVLLVAIPLMRPLRSAELMSRDEYLRLATADAIVERGTLELIGASTMASREDLSGLVTSGGRLYSAQPPAFAVLIALPLRILKGMEYSLLDDQTAVLCVLTMLFVILPISFSAGLIYRMGRMFELRRSLRVLVAATAVFGTGLISYSVILSAEALSACLLISASFCVLKVEFAPKPRRSAGLFILGGLLAFLGAAIEPWALVPAVLFPLVIASTNFSWRFRAGGCVLYAIGTIAPLVLHYSWNSRVTGDILPPFMHPEMSAVAMRYELDDEIEPQVSTLGRIARNLFTGVVGQHGVFSHFPVLVIAVLGVAAVMHRHWPTPIKVLAGVSLASTIAVVVSICLTRTDWSSAMFAAKWYIVVLPMLVLWSGAWLRREHRPITWTMSAVVLSLSVVASIVGAVLIPHDGYRGVEALVEQLHRTRLM